MKKTAPRSKCLPKFLIFMFALFPICIACNQQSDEGISNKDVPDVDPIEGVWELANHYWVKDGDTLLPEPDEIGVQHKIFLDGYVMWTTDPLSDSSEWHGYGTYRLNNDVLIEKFLSMSLPMKAEMGSESEVIRKIEYDENSYKQETESVLRNTVYQSIEEWKRLK
ncbi:MAG: hypothetical protein GY790_10335 [Bacteroidetes bacterium]|nr:hypothetical protein [Bacteroidota bacterium]